MNSDTHGLSTQEYRAVLIVTLQYSYKMSFLLFDMCSKYVCASRDICENMKKLDNLCEQPFYSIMQLFDKIKPQNKHDKLGTKLTHPKRAYFRDFV